MNSHRRLSEHGNGTNGTLPDASLPIPTDPDQISTFDKASWVSRLFAFWTIHIIRKPVDEFRDPSTVDPLPKYFTIDRWYT
jgi:hypothetical protein